MNKNNELHLKEEWFAEAKEMTMEKLPEFIRHLTYDYNHDYGTVCHAMAAVGFAAMKAFDHGPMGGITGFQASCVLWDIISEWQYPNNKCGLRIQDMDNLLYPQYDYKFKSISESTWDAVKSEAERNLELANQKGEFVHPKVMKHWGEIVKGIIPFGLEIKEG